MQDNLSEDDISVKFITPAIVKVGWDEATQNRRRVSFTMGRIKLVPIALIEAKKSKRHKAMELDEQGDASAPADEVATA